MYPASRSLWIRRLRSKGPGPGQVLGCLLFVAGMLLLMAGTVQHHYGSLSHKVWPLPDASRIKVQGYAYKVQLPTWARTPGVDDSLQILRNGTPVGTRARKASTIIETGGGAYKRQGNYAYLSLPLNEDLRAIVGELALRLPSVVRTKLWIGSTGLLLAGCVMLVLTRRTSEPKTGAGLPARRQGSRISPSASLLAVFALSLTATLWRLPSSLEFSDGWFSAKGIPYSDALGWDELARNYSAGAGFTGAFSSQRPLYPVMLSLAYAVAGPSLYTAKLMNALWAACGATVVFGIGMACRSRVAGLAGALTLLWGTNYVEFRQVLLTETIGALLGAVGILCLYVALLRPKPGWIILAGLTLAAANLASGFAILALAGYSGIALLAWGVRGTWVKAVQHTLLLIATVIITWAPWMYRQQVVHGFTNLAGNSATLLYAAASKSHRWNEETETAWKEAGVANDLGERYHFYNREFVKLVKADPAAYLTTVWRGTKTFFTAHRFMGGDHFVLPFLAVLLGSAVLFLRTRDWAAAIAGAVVNTAVWASYGAHGGWLWAGGTLVVLSLAGRDSRWMWALVAVTVPAVALLHGLTGGTLTRRMWTGCEWAIPLLVTGAGVLAMGHLRRLLLMMPALRGLGQGSREGEEGATPHASGRVPGDFKPVKRLALTSALAVVLWTGAAMAAGFIQSLRSVETKYTWVPGISSKELSQALGKDIQTLVAGRYGEHGLDEQGLENLWLGTTLFTDYICEMGPHENAAHWCRAFAVRPYRRVVALPHNAPPMLLNTKLKDIPLYRPLLVVGVRNFDEEAFLGHAPTIIEVLGYLLLEPESTADTLDPEKVIWLPPSEEAINIMRHHKRDPSASKSSCPPPGRGRGAGGWPRRKAAP